MTLYHFIIYILNQKIKKKKNKFHRIYTLKIINNYKVYLYNSFNEEFKLNHINKGIYRVIVFLI